MGVSLLGIPHFVRDDGNSERARVFERQVGQEIAVETKEKRQGAAEAGPYEDKAILLVDRGT